MEGAGMAMGLNAQPNQTRSQISRHCSPIISEQAGSYFRALNENMLGEAWGEG